MKRILSVITVIAVLFGTFMMPAAAKTSEEVVRDLYRSQVFIDDMTKLCKAIDSGNAGDIFAMVLETYPDIVSQLKKGMNEQGTVTSGNVREDGDRYERAIAALIKSTVIFDDFTELAEVIRTGDPGEIYATILEIYPDIIVTLEKGLVRDAGAPFGIDISVDPDAHENVPEKDNSALPYVFAGVFGIILGAGTVYFLMKRKKYTY